MQQLEYYTVVTPIPEPKVHCPCPLSRDYRYVSPATIILFLVLYWGHGYQSWMQTTWIDYHINGCILAQNNLSRDHTSQFFPFCFMHTKAVP